MEKKAQAGHPTAVMNLATLRALQGRHAEARAATERFLAMAEKNRYYHHLTYGAVRVYALGGDAEQAARWLQETIRWGFPCYPLFAERPHARSRPEVARSSSVSWRNCAPSGSATARSWTRVSQRVTSAQCTAICIRICNRNS